MTGEWQWGRHKFLWGGVHVPPGLLGLGEVLWGDMAVFLEA
jgi:hypothetical protein